MCQPREEMKCGPCRCPWQLDPPEGDSEVLLRSEAGTLSPWAEEVETIMNKYTETNGKGMTPGWSPHAGEHDTSRSFCSMRGQLT